MPKLFYIRRNQYMGKMGRIVLSYQGNNFKQCLTDIIELYLKFERDY
jgi:hypothetical protein